MRVLIACEFTGEVRDAFLAKGHDAWSCDILPSEREGPHLQCKVQKILDLKWDMLIAFPPCTYLSSAGMMWNSPMPWRVKETIRSLYFVAKLVNSHIERICIANPVGILSTVYRKPDQIIHPWQFGHPETKRTCLWLHNLPLLRSTQLVEPTKSKVQNEPGGRNQSKNRSRTFSGIASAMANQWG